MWLFKTVLHLELASVKNEGCAENLNLEFSGHHLCVRIISICCEKLTVVKYIVHSTCPLSFIL